MARTAGILFAELQVNGSSDLKGLKSLCVELFKSYRMDMLRTQVYEYDEQECAMFYR